MGILQNQPDHWFQKGAEGDLNSESIENLVAERTEAKLAKNYARADEIREQLEQNGVVLEDSREGTKWRRL